MAGRQGSVATPTPKQAPNSTPTIHTTSYYTPSSAAPSGSGVQKQQSPSATQNGALKAAASRVWLAARKTLRGQFISLAALTLLLSLLLALYSWQSLTRASNDLETIASGSVPSVDAAQTMGQYINDIDAKVADFLATGSLTTQEPCSLVTAHGSTVIGQLTVHDCDQHNIDAEIVMTNQQLFNAIHNASYPGERTATERITVGLEEYVGDWTVIQQEYAAAASKNDPNDPHLSKAYATYLHANAILQTKIHHTPQFVEDFASLPSCSIGADQHLADPKEWAFGGIESNVECLSSINNEHLQQAYGDSQNFLTMTFWVSLLFCLTFGTLLLFVVLRLMFMNHRVLNPGLTPALLICVVISLLLLATMGNLMGQPASADALQHGAYQQLVQDDYASVYAATRLKRIGTQANADESRWLIALAFKDQEQINKWDADWQANVKQIETLKQAAHNNRTWNEEDQPLSAMDQQWQAYKSIDVRIRAVAGGGDLNGAETLSTGESNTDFSGFSDAVSALSKANYDHYNQTLADTRSAINLYLWLTVLLFPLTGLLTVWGVLQRLKDF
ncbi:tetratricopeptide repeat protein [Tengunoibacter tsumagoiensis]|uniref:Uncharacterized protein n=1 Tax=Tengunoibacter tsumagoiensis TaxID=2014871 RepID=A0A402A396_9CHLR|nr:tetratricopeptide repeat protein [Tengunoibacter tsumagoiensis]GCE13627.1 hypothetical protein KTT_34860 [Tengunoibacter tsumagoiensis]